MPDTRVMTLDLTSAEELMAHVVQDDTLREQLANAIWYAEEGDICNDVFLFDNVSAFIAQAVIHQIDYVING